MRNAIRVAMAGTALLICAASATPYQDKGFRGGVSHRAISPGTWSITAAGNGFTSRSTLVEYTHRRAGELCPGGYDVLDKDSNTETVRCGNTDCNKSDTALIVRCRSGSSSAPVRQGDSDPSALPRN